MQMFPIDGYENSTRKTLAKMSAYYTTTKSFAGVMLRQTDADAADQAHFILRINFSNLYITTWLNVFLTPKFLKLLKRWM